MKKIILFILILLAVIGLTQTRRQFSSIRTGGDIRFKTIHGETINMADLTGQAVLINFWASDCLPCLEEIPQLAALRRDLPTLAIIAVAMPYDPPNRIIELANRENIPYAVALDPQAEINQAFGGVNLTPTWFLFDKNGRLIKKELGRLDWTQLRLTLQELV